MGGFASKHSCLFLVIKIGRCQNKSTKVNSSFLEGQKKKSVNRKCSSVCNSSQLITFLQSLHALTQFEQILSRVLHRCGCARMLRSSWLCLPPLTAFSETWLSSVFIGSCPGLTSNGEVRGVPPTTAADGLLYRSGKCMCRVFTSGNASHKSIFEHGGLV